MILFSELDTTFDVLNEVTNGMCSVNEKDEIIVDKKFVNNYMLPDKGTLISLVREKEKENIRKEYFKQLQNILFSKRKDLKSYISGMNIDIEQEEAFNFKYQLALAAKQDDDNAKEELKVEADIRGVSVEDLADLIIQKHDLWINTLKSFNQKIEVFRIKMNELINNNEFDKAKEVLEKANNLGISTSYEDILNLFK